MQQILTDIILTNVHVKLFSWTFLFSQGSVATDMRGGVSFNFSFLYIFSLNSAVKKWKSVHFCHSCHKNKLPTFSETVWSKPGICADFADLCYCYGRVEHAVFCSSSCSVSYRSVLYVNIDANITSAELQLLPAVFPPSLYIVFLID